jgi:Outer membrane protein beta-barrel domain
VLKKHLLFTPLITLFLFPFPTLLHGQALPAARGGSHLVAGGYFSTFRPDYGTNWLSGIGAYADLNVGAHLSVEAEARFLRFNQVVDVHEDNYLVGPRYRWHYGRFQPYAKFLLGNGQFNFPFNYAHGGYFMFAPGGGLDITLKHHFVVRAIDYEYQHWSSFQGSSLSPNGFSFGIGYRVF